MTAEPARSREIELKFDVDDGTLLPDWTAIPGIAAVSSGESRALDAWYFDDADAALGRSGYALRRRTGGPDEGWHIKGPRGADGGRTELHWPLSLGDDVPLDVAHHVATVSTGPFTPLARIRNARVAYDLLDADGGVIAEVADDHVSTRDERSGAERSWHEWEIELGPAAPADHAAFFAAVEQAALSAGARPAASDSKLARALGL